MGLAAPRNKNKISADPRNTHWASNTTNFGHRILTSHGWTPGSTLGDTSSSYHSSGHITEASNTGVKIVLKGDNLGIGCKGGIKDDECTGLDLFQDLLGRLNGKGKEVEKRVQQRKVELVSGRYGMRFVRGEAYVSSDIDKLLEDTRRVEEEKATAEKKEKGRRRRKKSERKAAKASKAEQEDQPEESPASPHAEELILGEKKGKKEKKPRKPRSSTPVPTSTSDSESKSKKRKRTDDAKKSKKSKRDKRDREDKKKRSKEFSDTETPALTSGTVTPTALTGRHAIRHKYIAAKRSAVVDTKALNEIFMIKA